MSLVRIFVLVLLFVGTRALLEAEVETEEISWVDTKEDLRHYCKRCHSDDDPDAGLDLVTIDHRADFEASPEKWLGIMQALRTHYMPHPDGRDLPLEVRERLVGKLQSEFVRLAADYMPSSASLRRLNRNEFNNTLNDLFLVDADLSATLPDDNAGYGFDNNAATLSFSPLLMERYFSAASDVGDIAIPRKMKPVQWSAPVASFRGGRPLEVTSWISTSGAKSAVRGKVYFAGRGRYDLKVAISATQAGDESARAELRLDGAVLGEYEVTADRDDAPNVFSLSIYVAHPGDKEFEVRFLNDFFRETEGRKEDRNLIFHTVNFHGPFQSAQDLESPFLARHFAQQLESLSVGALRDGIFRFVSRAYRRPATEEEVSSLWHLFLESRTTGPREWSNRKGLRAVVDAVVTSPSFLFRNEGGEPDDSFALASWLSYFLWSSMPDDRLFYLARRGNLAANLQSEVRRMLADPKAEAFADNFAGQWWRFRDLEIHAPDTTVYANAKPELLADMREETRRFFIELMQSDGSLLDMLSADYSFINQRLAKHYGIGGVEGEGFRRVSLQGTQRRGIWSQASVLTVTSHPNHTSPVLRGQWVLENLIGLSPPPPPDNVPSLPGTEGKPKPADLRASLALHRENPDCAACHNTMDPIGLALETYDGIGALRSKQERDLLSPETLFDGFEVREPADLAMYFESRRSDDFVLNMARKLSIYASGRGLKWQDEAVLYRIVGQTRSEDYRFSALVESVVEAFAPVPNLIKLSQVRP